MNNRWIRCIKSWSILISTRVIFIDSLMRPFQTSQDTENTPCLRFFSTIDLINKCFEFVILLIVLSIQVNDCNL